MKTKQDCPAKGEKAEDKVCKKCGRVFTTEWIDDMIKRKLQEQAKEIKKCLMEFHLHQFMYLNGREDDWNEFWDKYTGKEEGK